MKICAIICEYNPLHNGHVYQIEKARQLSGADAVVCIMSGNFVQRGEEAIIEKHKRAKHAIYAGADAVIELPVPFATSPAELFAKGGVKIAHLIGANYLCFGVENGAKEDFLRGANTLIKEGEKEREKMKAYLKEGLSLAKARSMVYDNVDLLTPNNILGLAYTKSILENGYNMEILPIERVGAGYHEKELSNYASATAIRENFDNISLLKSWNCLPSFSLDDLPKKKNSHLLGLEKLAILSTPLEEIARVCDCTEGIENALKKQAAKGSDLVKKLTSKRYTASRIRRILLQNLLTIRLDFILQALEEDSYLHLLAIGKKNEELLSYLGNRKVPLLVRNADGKKLKGFASKLYKKEEYADDIYSILTNGTKPKAQPFIE